MIYLNHLNNDLINHVKDWGLELGIHINYPVDLTQQPTLEFSSDWIRSYKDIVTVENTSINLLVWIVGGIIAGLFIWYFTGSVVSASVIKPSIIAKTVSIPVASAKVACFSKAAIIAEAAIEFRQNFSFLWQSQMSKQVLGKIKQWEELHGQLLKVPRFGDAPIVEATMNIAERAEDRITKQLQYLTKQEAPICNTPVEGVYYENVNLFLLKHQDTFIKLAGYVADSHWDFPT